MERKEHFTLRLAPSTLRRLVRHAAISGVPKTALAEQFIEEGVRMVGHPGIVFRTGPGGRRAGLAGIGLDVWEIVESVENEGGNVQTAAEYLGITPAAVSAAMGYYSEYSDEIDRWIALNREESEEAEAAWRRRQAAIAGT
jgi:uncharacterized protein (DUF433 family)